MICAYGAGLLADGGSDSRAERAAARHGGGMLDDAADRIAADAARQVPESELRDAALKGMLRRLGDRWARHYPAGEYDDLRGRLDGSYSGVGLWLGTTDDERRVRVASVQPRSAAARAGVRVGDVIVAVDGEPAAGSDVTEVAAALRGEQSSEVRLEVRRGRAELAFRLDRSAVQTSDVGVEHYPRDVRLIRIAAFTRGTGRQVRDLVENRPDRHRGGLMLDLRGNPGGLLDEAVETASAFLPDGLVVTYERRGEPAQRRMVTRPGETDTPLVVLVDAGTASAAEVVAGSLRDRERAVIIGSRTFGKGSVQEPIKLADGSAVELTVGRYRTPSGRNLDGVGIDPDVAISADRPPQVAEQRGQTVLRGLHATMPTKDRG